MRFDPPLVEGHLERRYKRFLADVVLTDGSRITAHCPNTGSMLGCAEPGSRVWLSRSGNRRRRYPYTWELVEVAGGVLVGVNTARTNGLVREAVTNGTIKELAAPETAIRREVAYGRERSRVDLVVEHPGNGPTYVEVKNVTMSDHGRIARWPDAVSQRGTRHARELAALARNGIRAVIVFCVQRSDAASLQPADDIDPAYGRALRQALSDGVEALAYRADVSLAGVVLMHRIPVRCPQHAIATG